MRSLQGCQAQPKHTDFKWEPLGFTEGETKVARMRRIPYSFIIALHPEGCWVELRPYYQTGHIRVHIPQGAMILFAGDIVHGGSAYDKDNHRIHGYFKTRGHGLPSDPSLFSTPPEGMPHPATQTECPDWGISHNALGVSADWAEGSAVQEVFQQTMAGQ